ncbi:MAG: tRNA lysidine(34) synthetase TilS [Rhodobacteraceae bacterium]|nr:tRNA lysidine(34) synthetase TilS [Paracoccaceae bacterium]
MRNPGRVGVAVSGGSDSLALLHGLLDAGAQTMVATVDHGLRDGAAEEAAEVERQCTALGVSHDILRRTDVPGGNLQADARKARYRLLADWAAGHGLRTLVLGHTLNDQAETFLLRLKRGSGVDGLSGMAMESRRHGLTLWRPLLGRCREDLRAYLRHKGVVWADDPSNDDMAFDRVKARKILKVLSELGLHAEDFSQVAARMARARQALEEATLALARQVAEVYNIGSVALDVPALSAAPAELRLRLIAHTLCWVASADYRPRANALDRLWAAMMDERPHTLHGCMGHPIRGRFYEIVREIAVMPVSENIGAYDTRWVCDPSAGTVAPLTKKGMRDCPEWRATGWSGIALAASPSLWRDGELLSAPFAGKAGAWTCRLKGGAESFFSSILKY